MPNGGVSIVVCRASANFIAVTQKYWTSVFISRERNRISREHIGTVQSKGDLPIALRLTLRAIHRS